jgi:hypothetical protein
MDLILAAALIVLHTIDGQEVTINPAQVTSLHHTNEAATGNPNTVMATGLRCVIGLSNGKMISVIENCTDVRAMIEKIP